MTVTQHLEAIGESTGEPRAGEVDKTRGDACRSGGITSHYDVVDEQFTVVDHVEAGAVIATDYAVLKERGLLATGVPQQAAIVAIHVEAPDQTVYLIQRDRVTGRIEVNLDVIHDDRAIVVHPTVVDVQCWGVDRVSDVN